MAEKVGIGEFFPVMSNQTEQLINDLPSQYDHSSARAQTKFWEEKGFSIATLILIRTYAVVIPPPNVTGYIWDTLNDSLQDTLVRMKRMQGFEHCGFQAPTMLELLRKPSLRRDCWSRKETRWDLTRR